MDIFLKDIAFIRIALGEARTSINFLCYEFLAQALSAQLKSNPRLLGEKQEAK